jgi:hypothetical protein
MILKWHDFKPRIVLKNFNFFFEILETFHHRVTPVVTLKDNVGVTDGNKISWCKKQCVELCCRVVSLCVCVVGVSGVKLGHSGGSPFWKIIFC